MMTCAKKSAVNQIAFAISNSKIQTQTEIYPVFCAIANFQQAGKLLIN